MPRLPSFTTVYNSDSQGRIQGAIASSKPAKVILLTMILYNSENSIRDIKSFSRPLFCRSSVVKYSLLHLSYSSEPVMRLDYEILLKSPHPFNDHRSQLIGSSLFCYNSLAAAAREVFNPSPDSASLVVSSQKKIFQFWFRGSLGGASQVGVFSRF